MDVNAFQDYLKKIGKSGNTVAAYCKDIEIFSQAQAEKGDGDIDHATETDVVSYVLKLKTEGKSTATINRKLSSIRTYYGFLIENKVISDDPTKGIKSPKVERKELEYLPLEEVDKLLSAPDESPKGLRDRAILEMMYATGIRVSELIETKLENVNLRMGFVMCSGNHGKARVVPLGRPARAALETYIYDVRNGLIGDRETDILFVNYSGEPLTRQGIWKILKEYAKKVELSVNITPQTLRNSFAVHMLQNGADLKALQELMGHEDISATEAYLAVTKTRIKDVYDKTHPRA